MGEATTGRTVHRAKCMFGTGLYLYGQIIRKTCVVAFSEITQ
jgi:hypothetical protein